MRWAWRAVPPVPAGPRSELGRRSCHPDALQLFGSRVSKLFTRLTLTARTALEARRGRTFLKLKIHFQMAFGAPGRWKSTGKSRAAFLCRLTRRLPRWESRQSEAWALFLPDNGSFKARTPVPHITRGGQMWSRSCSELEKRVLQRKGGGGELGKPGFYFKIKPGSLKSFPRVTLSSR